MENKKIKNYKDIICAKAYRGHTINNGRIHDFGCYVKTLDQVIDQSEYMLAKHSKVLSVRMDIRNPKDSERQIKRSDITRILENAKRKLDSHYKGCPNQLDFNYVWTAENEGTDKNPHFHLFISVNGNTCQNGYGIFKAVEKAVSARLGKEYGGLVEFSKSNGKYGLRVNRDSYNWQKELDESIYAGSYLAKVNSKEGRPKGARVSSASRIERKKVSEDFENEIDKLHNNAVETPKERSDRIPLAVFEYIRGYRPEDTGSILCPPESCSLSEEEEDALPEGRIL